MKSICDENNRNMKESEIIMKEIIINDEMKARNVENNNNERRRENNGSEEIMKWKKWK